MDSLADRLTFLCISTGEQMHKYRLLDAQLCTLIILGSKCASRQLQVQLEVVLGFDQLGVLFQESCPICYII